MPTFYYEHDEFYSPEELYNMMHEDEIKEMYQLCKDHFNKREQSPSLMEEEFIEYCENLSKNYIKLTDEEIELIKKLSQKIL